MPKIEKKKSAKTKTAKKANPSRLFKKEDYEKVLKSLDSATSVFMVINVKEKSGEDKAHVVIVGNGASLVSSLATVLAEAQPRGLIERALMLSMSDDAVFDKLLDSMGKKIIC